MIISKKKQKNKTKKKTRLHLHVHSFRNIFVVVIVASVAVCWEKKKFLSFFYSLLLLLLLLLLHMYYIAMVIIITMAMFRVVNSLFVCLFVCFKDTESALPKESLPKMSAPKKSVFIFASFSCLFVYLLVCLFMFLGVLFEFLTTDHYQMIKPTSTHWICIG